MIKPEVFNLMKEGKVHLALQKLNSTASFLSKKHRTEVRTFYMQLSSDKNYKDAYDYAMDTLGSLNKRELYYDPLIEEIPKEMVDGFEFDNERPYDMIHAGKNA